MKFNLEKHRKQMINIGQNTLTKQTDVKKYDINKTERNLINNECKLQPFCLTRCDF